MTKTPINICGSERSGSTMLDLILGNDPKAFSCGEVYALFRPWRTHHFRPVCRCGEMCDFLAAFLQVREEAFHNLLFDSFGFDWIVDSSKDLSWVVDNQRWAIRDGRRILNLVTWKHPTSFVVSYLKRGRNPDEWRTVFINYYKNFLDTRLPYVSLCHDEFVRAPQAYVKAICELVGMEYSAEKLNFWEKRHHQVFGSGGTAQQVDAGSSHIHRPEEIPEEFSGRIDLVRRSLVNDSVILDIIEKLRKNDLLAGRVAKDAVFNWRHPGKRTLWYHSHKLRLRMKRFFPEPFP